MRLLRLFYSSDDEACGEVLEMLQYLAEQRDDILFYAFDVTTEAGMRQAQEHGVQDVPTTIVDGDRIIKGVPHSPDQVLDER